MQLTTTAIVAFVALDVVFMGAALVPRSRTALLRLVEGHTLHGHLRRDLLALHRRRIARAHATIAAAQAAETELHRRIDALWDLDPAALIDTFAAQRAAQIDAAHAELGAWQQAAARARRVLDTLPTPDRVVPLPLGNRIRRAVDAAARSPHELDADRRFRLDVANARLEAGAIMCVGFAVTALVAPAFTGLSAGGLLLALAFAGLSATAHTAAMGAASTYGSLLGGDAA